jgi:divalent metal cation (Fe/Co/Zn/Cd) transporter
VGKKWDANLRQRPAVSHLKRPLNRFLSSFEKAIESFVFTYQITRKSSSSLTESEPRSLKMRPDPSMGSEQDIRHAISLRPSPFHSSHHHLSGSETPHSLRDFHRSDTDPVIAASAVLSGVSTPLPKSPDSLAGDNFGPGGLSHHASAPVGHSTAYQSSNNLDDAVSRHAAGAGHEHEVDIEGQQDGSITGRYSPVNDPYRLSSKLKSDEEINQIKANTSKKRASDEVSIKRSKRLAFCAPFVASGEAAWRSRKLENFYQSQNENIQRFLKPVDDHRREAKDTHGENQLRFKIAVRGSFAANLCLAALQVYAAVASGSLALFTTMADALFDPLSNVTLILSNRAVNRVDGRRFPSGKARIETAGNIVFCFLMTAVSCVIISQSARDLAEGSKTKTSPFHLPSIIAVSIAFFTKLGLFLYCFALRNMYSQIRILWEDHRNDLIINGVGVMFSLLGSKVAWWIDPVGAIILSCLIIFLWLRTAYSEFMLLIGVSADTSQLQLITYICKFCLIDQSIGY